jgi:hypothetical protein
MKPYKEETYHITYKVFPTVVKIGESGRRERKKKI